MGHKPFQELRDKIKDYKEIWLESRPIPPAPQDDRTWRQNNEYEDGYYGRKATRYIRADICDDLNNQLLERQVSDTKIIIELEGRLEAIEKTIKAEQDYSIYWRKRAETAEKRATACHHRAMTAEATIKEISELPEKWRYHGDGECNCLTCVCANELQAALNRSKS